LLDEGGSEAVKTGRHCRVGGKKVSRPRSCQRNFEGLCGLFHETVRAGKNRQRCMSFIQMANLRCEAEGAKQAPTANPEDHLLLEAKLWPAAVQLAGDPSM